MIYRKKNCYVVLAPCALFILYLIIIICFKKNIYCCTGNLTIIPGKSYLYLESFDTRIDGWDNGGITYFFLPSYAMVDRIDQTYSYSKLYLPDNHLLTDPKLGTIQDILVLSQDGAVTPWKIAFFKSCNLPTVSISLPDKEYTDITHDSYLHASIDIISPSGGISYSEDEILVKGRGNGSWKENKRPYQIKLPKAVGLCNMGKADKWALLANTMDPTKAKNKLVFDLASAIGMEYYIESDWVDLYINDEYIGNYLLCHEPDIGKNDLNIRNLQENNQSFFADNYIETDSIKGYSYRTPFDCSGGYLIEVLPRNYYNKKKCGFRTDNNYFSTKSPDNASLEEVTYIANYIDSVDKTINVLTQDSQLRYIDEYSFARRYLLEEISLNCDAARSSYYFYKKPYDDILYAGPNWDYDAAFGLWDSLSDYSLLTTNFYEMNPEFSNVPTINSPAADYLLPLLWDEKLLDNTDYKDYVKNVFLKNKDVFDYFLTKKIDDYYSFLNESIIMDYLRWEQENSFCYISPEANYRYLKFFFYKRLNTIANEFEADIEFSYPEINNSCIHTISLYYPDGHFEKKTVEDGAQLDQEHLPAYDKAIYNGWVYKNTGKQPSCFKPIYEDISLELSLAE